MRRFGVFNLVGVLGFAVQLTVLWLLVRFAGVHYLVATAIATEAAILHNFAWHRLWTWRDRAATPRGWLRRLGRFHVANGAVSLAGNVALMAVLAGVLRMPYLPANLLAVLACATVNFFTGDRWVFREDEGRPLPTRPPTTVRRRRSARAGTSRAARPRPALP